MNDGRVPQTGFENIKHRKDVKNPAKVHGSLLPSGTGTWTPKLMMSLTWLSSKGKQEYRNVASRAAVADDNLNMDGFSNLEKVMKVIHVEILKSLNNGGSGTY